MAQLSPSEDDKRGEKASSNSIEMTTINAWAKFVTQRHRLCVALIVGITVVLAAGLPQIGFDIRPNATFMADNQVSRDLEKMQALFGPDDNDLVILLAGDTLLEPNGLDAMRKFRDQIAAIPQIESVASIFDLKKPGRVAPLIPLYRSDSFDSDELRRELVRHPIGSNQMVAANGDLIVFVARMSGGSLAVSAIADSIESINEHADELESATSAEVLLAGHPAIRADVLTTLQSAMMVGCTAAVIIAFFVSMILFRRLIPVLAVVAAPTIGAVWTFGLIAWANIAVGGLLSALPNLVYVVGLTDAIHLVLDYRRHLRHGLSRSESVAQSLRQVGPACFLTSLTTFIGFGSLAFSNTASVQEFGIWSAIGTTLALLAVVFALPTILLAIPADWMADRNPRPERLGNWVNRIVAPTLRRPGITTLFAIALSLGLLYPAVHQRPDIIWTEAIPNNSSSVVAMNRADKQIGGALLVYVALRWPDSESFVSPEVLDVASQTQSMLRDEPGFHGAFSVLNILAAAPGRSIDQKARSVQSTAASQLKQLINFDENFLVVSARVPNDGAHALNQRLAGIEEKIGALRLQHPDFEFLLSGTVVAASKNMNAIILDLARSLAIAAALIFIVIAIAFRSIKIGLLSVIPNSLPLLVTAAALTLFDQPLQITAAVSFSLCLGLAVDDTIHVLIRYQSARRSQHDPRLAMQDALSHVGPALVATTLILLGGFAALMVSPLPSIRLFSTLSSATLVTALVGDLLFLPAMLVYAAKWSR